MKILGWMHRKFRQNSSETLKEYSIGFTQPSFDDLQSYRKGGYGSKPFTRGHRDIYRRNSFTSLEAAREEEENLEEERATALNELFHGFLAIGTLGTEPVTTDPATPTFSISVDHIAEKETEVTENELKLINDELEKVLAAEGESCNASSGRNSHVSARRSSHVSTGRNSHVSAGRNSHVSAGRMSHCSTITLSGKPTESAETCGSEATICPLQNYLLGSAVGLQETTPPVKKEQRASLGELFQKTKHAEENSGTKSNRAEKRTDKDTDRSAVHIMKKMLKRRIIRASTRSNTADSGGVIDSTTADTKVNKLLQIFSRKVHPENSTSYSRSRYPKRKESKNNDTHSMACNIEDLRLSAEDIIIYPQQAISKENTCSYKNQSQLTKHTKSSGDTAGSELWVKTDADYLVLEL